MLDRVQNKNKIVWASIAWIANLQFFIVQIIVGLAFMSSYSLANNTISDLGNTQCATYGSREVCSTLHPLMNTSFIILGLTIIIGALLYSKSLSFKNERLSSLGFLMLGLSGIGSIIVGLFPENTTGLAHLLGAALSFILGNLGLILVSLSNSARLRSSFRYASIMAGTIALTATLLLATNNYFYLGLGGVERIAAYVQTIWMIFFGIHILRSSHKSPNETRSS